MPTFTRRDREEMEKAQDLLEGGTSEVGFVRSLFFGRLRLDRMMPYPRETEGERLRVEEMIGEVEAFLKSSVDPDRIDREERIGEEVIRGLGEIGVLGMTIPVAYGGGGFSHTAYCRVLERISAWCASTAVLIGAHQSIGMKAILLCGTEEQKRRFLPKLARGKELAAFCLSEPEVGSDAANVQCRARLSEDGGFWILNGEKKFATNAAIAGVLTVMARTEVEAGGKKREKVTAFIVTPDLEGFEVVSGNRSKCGIRGSWQGTLKFTEMRVPVDRVLGELGKGLKVALSCLDYGRCSLSAGCVGGAKKALEMAVERARTRKQFGRVIGEFGLVQKKIARMAETVFAMESMTYLVGPWVDGHSVDGHGGDLMLESAICKLFCSEGLWEVIDDAMQIWGGEGYMREHGIERMMRDARINRIVEGTSEVMTAFISLVGMKGVGEELEGVVKAARHPVGNFGRLAEFAQRQWRDVVVGGGGMEVCEELAWEGKAVSGLTRDLARGVIRLLQKHREKILDMELLHERVAGSVVDLFAMAAVVSRLQRRVEERGAGEGDEESLRRDLIVGKGFCRSAAGRVGRNLKGLFVNEDEGVVGVARAVLGEG